MGVNAIIDSEALWTQFIAHKTPELRNELIVRYSPLVRGVVGRLGIPPTGLLDSEDLVSYGTIGLINAIDRFDPQRGVRFEAFASMRIRGAVIDQMRVLNWIPRSAVSRMRQMESALSSVEQRLGRPARESEVAQELGVSVEKYRHMLTEINTTVLSLDAPLGSLIQDDEVTSLSELLEDHSSPGPVEQIERREVSELLIMAIERLPARERMLLSLYYEKELTMKEISKILGVSESRICQLHIQALVRLRVFFLPYQANLGKGDAIFQEKQQQTRSERLAKSRKREKITQDNDVPVSTTYLSLSTQQSRAHMG
jgi:RNA polymerase sigma factor for flagellar operon FliA